MVSGPAAGASAEARKPPKAPQARTRRWSPGEQRSTAGPASEPRRTVYLLGLVGERPGASRSGPRIRTGGRRSIGRRRANPVGVKRIRGQTRAKIAQLLAAGESHVQRTLASRASLPRPHLRNPTCARAPIQRRSRRAHFDRLSIESSSRALGSRRGPALLVRPRVRRVYAAKRSMSRSQAASPIRRSLSTSPTRYMSSSGIGSRSCTMPRVPASTLPRPRFHARELGQILRELGALTRSRES